MLKLAGIAAAPGVAIGKAQLFGWRVEVFERLVVPEQVEAELARFDKAAALSDGQLLRIQEQIAAEEGDEHQQYQILEAHRLMLRDPHLDAEARRLIRTELCAAEWAVRRALNQIRAVFDRIADPYFRERRSDIDAVGERLLRNLLQNVESSKSDVSAGGIAFGHDLSPADIAQLGRGGVLAFFSEAGGKTSHSAVVARALGLPLVVGVHDISAQLRSGVMVIVDGTRGEVIVDPDKDAIVQYEARAVRARQREQRLETIRSKAAETEDGQRIHLAANVELLEEIPAANALGAESIGLFRSEFLYLDRETLPTEDEQFEHVVSAIKMLDGRMTTIRTLDLGGDKMPPSVALPACANPALGMRSIRYSLWRPEIFKQQLRAFYRAAVYGPLRILFPLISGAGELRAVKAVCREVVADLQREGIEHRADVPLGVMIETPSAVFVADILARECDFMTIGTNDLIQYALAADRQDEHVGYLYHPLHPAILRAVKMTLAGAQSAGKPVAMCGDMAGDPMLTWVLVGLGLRDLSMSPRQIPLLKSIVRGTNLKTAQALAQRALTLSTVEQVEELVYGEMQKHFPDLDEETREVIAP